MLNMKMYLHFTFLRANECVVLIDESPLASLLRLQVVWDLFTILNVWVSREREAQINKKVSLYLA